MRTIVIGGAGFIGSNLCQTLIKRGHNVCCVDDLSLGTEKNIEKLEGRKEFSFSKGNAADEAWLGSVFEEEKPEYVFHLAANSDIKASATSPSIEYERTYSTTFSILSCMRNHKVGKLFFASTSAVYGDKRDIILNETTPGLEPVSYYGAAKLGSEALISAFSHMNDMKSLIFRFPNVIGPGLTHGVIFDFIAKLKNNPHKLEILGDGSQSKPYIYVNDLIDAIMLEAFRNESIMEIYNIGVEGKTSVTSIADMVCEAMGLKDVHYEYTGGNIGWKGDVPSYQYDLTKIHDRGWKAAFNSDEAVKATLESLKLNQ